MRKDSTNRWARFAALALSAALGWTAVATAQASSQWMRAGAVEGRLVTASKGVGNEAELRLGLHLRMDEGWKTYWRSPGESGLPPALDWSASTNLQSPALSYPAPHRFEFAGIQSFGYKGEVVLPVSARVERAGELVHAKVKVDLLVCSTLCVPQTLQLSLTVPQGPAAPSEDAALLQDFASQVPGDATKHGVRIEHLELDKDGSKQSLVVQVTAAQPFVAPDAFVEGLPADVELGPPVVALRANGMKASLRLPVIQHASGGTDLIGKQVMVTVADGTRSAEATEVVRAGVSSAPVFVLMVAMALVGGLILNLMPCVLPVLSLKLLSAVKAGGTHAKLRRSFLATGAGVVFSFMVLAAAAVGLKTAGMAVGWGVQFQQPLFLVFMVVLVAFFAANLWGFFEVPLPRFIADAAGSNTNGESSLAGNFMTGAFATLLATPCSAPFLGTAVGFALAGGPLEIVAIFAALGVGMALPYFLVAAFPGLAAWLPRPGAWMLKVKVVMGLALAATGIWLLWVLGAQIGPIPAAAVGTLMVLIWAFLAWHHHAPGRPRWSAALAIVSLSAAAFFIPANTVMLQAVAPDRSESAWRPFSEPVIREEVAAGRTVFVNVTADWCVTCQVNKRMVLNRGTVATRLFRDESVVAMQADWTNPNQTIADYLATFGKYGIPFNVVYGPRAPQGIVLSEVLTERAVLDALAKAVGAAPPIARSGLPG